MNTYRAHFKVPNVQATVVFEIRAAFKCEAKDAAKVLEFQVGLKFMYFEGE